MGKTKRVNKPKEDVRLKKGDSFKEALREIIDKKTVKKSD